jgi:molybdopterin-guanine dinucleotide biosynthesis protein A
MIEQTVGLVLAGGEGRRLGGGKPFRLLAGKRLIDHALDALDQVCAKTTVITGQVADFADLDCEVIADRWPGEGPMAAVVSALLDTGAENLLVLAVDLPLVRPQLLRLLMEQHGQAKAVAPLGPRGVEPLLALYSRACLPVGKRLLDKGERRTRRLLEGVRAKYLPEKMVRQVDPNGQSFLNINRPEDMAQAESLASGLLNTD